MQHRKTIKFSDLIFGNSPIEYWRPMSVHELQEIVGAGKTPGIGLMEFGDMSVTYDANGIIDYGSFYLVQQGRRIKLGNVSLICDEIYSGMTEWRHLHYLRRNNVPVTCYVHNPAGDPEVNHIINRRLSIRFWNWNHSDRFTAAKVDIFKDAIQHMSAMFKRDMPEFNLRSSLKKSVSPL